MKPRTLIFIPTFNERGNVERMYQELKALQLDTDILFLDDNSPDGTGTILDELAKKDPRLSVIHRTGKLGVGSAHQTGIGWAYDKGYEVLITLDCDFTHSPTDIHRLLPHLESADVVVGSRFLQKGSLSEWNLYRTFLTNFGHFLTRRMLKVQQDATGAFRVYNLARIPRELFGLVKSHGYSFFFESLFIFTRNGFPIKDLPIVLPKRTYGESKMSLRDALRSVQRLLALYWASITKPQQFRLQKAFTDVDPKLVDPQGWDAYWNKKKETSSVVYEWIAELYRTMVIRRQLNSAIRKAFANGAHLLHAGCGSGQVDTDIQREMQITAVDISVPALQLYQRHNPRAKAVRHASIFNLPFDTGTFDGVYNLGVMEHFTEDEINKILTEFHRVLQPKGKLVLLWPHRHATSVFVLGRIHWFLNHVLKKNVQLHPPEISLVRSREQIAGILQAAKFKMVSYKFGPKDFWVQAVIVAEKG